MPPHNHNNLPKGRLFTYLEDPGMIHPNLRDVGVWGVKLTPVDGGTFRVVPFGGSGVSIVSESGSLGHSIFYEKKISRAHICFAYWDVHFT